MISAHAIASLLIGRAAGIPARICYATTPDRLAACSLAHGHVGEHNSRHDASGVAWGRREP